MVVQGQPSILITDDDQDFRETLAEVLEPRGFRTLLAGDGPQALEIVRKEQVHVLVLDMHLPKLTGTGEAYLPPGHTLAGGKRARGTGDYEPWTPE